MPTPNSIMLNITPKTPLQPIAFKKNAYHFQTSYYFFNIKYTYINFHNHIILFLKFPHNNTIISICHCGFTSNNKTSRSVRLDLTTNYFFFCAYSLKKKKKKYIPQDISMHHTHTFILEIISSSQIFIKITLGLKFLNCKFA